MASMNMRKFGTGCALALLFMLYAAWLAYPINLESIDLGRLLMTGEIILRTPSLLPDILYTNFFTYTYTDFAIVNHHWFGAVLLRIFFKLGGFVPLHLFYIAMHLVTLGLYFRIAQKLSNTWVAFAVSLPLIILLGERMEVRPEGFAYLLSGITLWVLSEFATERLKEKWLWALPVIILFWTNIHVSFPIGLLFIGAFTISALLRARNEQEYRPLAKKLMIVFGCSILATLVNPSGIWGALYPFLVLQDHGLMIVENQSILFLEEWGLSKASFLFVKIATVFLLLGTILLLQKKRMNVLLPYLIIALPVLVLAWFGARHITTLGFMLIPTFAAMFTELHDEYEQVRGSFIPSVLASTLVLCAMIGGIANIPLLSRRPITIGLRSGASAAAEFIITNKIAGPIFNNFDVAGYLTYYLYPQELTFVDNRPEAHPAEFFTKVYLPMLKDSTFWKGVDQEFDFNMIVLNYKDRAEWIPQFLEARVGDPQWVPVFADGAIVIFVRNSLQNSVVTSRYRISPDTFVF